MGEMNPALVNRSTQNFATDVEFKAGLVLCLGANRQVVKRPSRLVVNSQFEQFDFTGTGTIDYIPDLPQRECYELFIGGDLYSTTFRTGTQTPSVRIVKRDDGKIELHLAEECTVLSSGSFLIAAD